MSQETLHTLFHPRAVAVIGASDDTTKHCYVVLMTLRASGVRGGIYGISRRLTEINGLQCFPDLRLQVLRGGLSLFASAGNEADVSVLDYMEYAIGHEPTRVIALLTDSLDDGPRLRRLAYAAHHAGKHVIALKIGESEAGAIDINPVMLGPNGAIAVDALVVPRGA
ncbi:MAG: CoA-binding protein, partial [Acetobacteraceae bacterium]|nr:CoA-binding protein [Acetobacteraceae bacterium]